MNIRISCPLIIVLGLCIFKLTLWLDEKANQQISTFRQSILSLACAPILIALACTVKYGIDLNAIYQIPSWWLEVIYLVAYWVCYVGAVTAAVATLILAIMRGLSQPFDD